jgi:short-subunit dehydrogenase
MNKLINKFAILTASAAGLGLVLRNRARNRARISFKGKSIVITGGSRGLGLVMARQLSDEGARLALLARNEEELESAKSELRLRDAEVMTLVCDIKDKEQLEAALDRVIRRYGEIDILINNAGIIQVGPLDHMAIEDFQEAMDVHFWAPLYATWYVLPKMKAKGSGRVVNITSIGGKIAVPHLLPYTASKYAMVGLSDGLRTELSKENIYITTVIPGLMRTGSHVNAWFKGRHRKEYTWFSLFSSLPITAAAAERAAHQIIEACRYAKPELVITPQARLLVIAENLFPQLTATGMKLMDHFLPPRHPRRGSEAFLGLDSQSGLSPSALTSLGDRAALENNQIRAGQRFL